MTTSKITIGSRKSALALVQTHGVRDLLLERYSSLDVPILHVVTTGDQSQDRDDPLPQIGGKGLFTAELEAALLKGEIDCAVHSLKDLPTEEDPRFVIAAILKRESPWDILVTPNKEDFASLAAGTIVGSSSVRRSAQILKLRPDLVVQSIRGNVDTRIGKLTREGFSYGATILAEAGISRLNRRGDISYVFTPDEMLPAAGQGALAIQCRADDSKSRELIGVLDDTPTRSEVSSERAFLSALGGGCNAPIACIARASVNGRLSFRGRCLSVDGSKSIEVRGEGMLKDAVSIGKRLAAEALNRGADSLILDLNL